MVDEQELLARVRRLQQRRKAALGCLMLAAVFAVGAAVYFVPGDPGDEAWRLGLFAVGAAVLVAVGLALARAGRLPPEADTPRMRLLRAEAMQPGRAIGLALIPLSLAFLLIGVVRSTSHIVAGQSVRHVELFMIGCFVLFLLAFLALLAGRGLDRWAAPAMEDELSRAYRAQAFQFGYAVLMPAVVALFVTGLVSPRLAVELAPIVAAVGVAAPALRLAWLSRPAPDET